MKSLTVTEHQTDADRDERNFEFRCRLYAMLGFLSVVGVVEGNDAIYEVAPEGSNEHFAGCLLTRMLREILVLKKIKGFDAELAELEELDTRSEIAA